MQNRLYSFRTTLLFLAFFVPCLLAQSQDNENHFDILALYTAKNDKAHISFVKEANAWFANAAIEYGFTYSPTKDWNNLNDNTLKNYELVIFLDTRPDSTDQRKAFEKYMKNGGAWMGFHFAAFALSPSLYPQNWNWYHNEFLGCGEYVSNTWRPTAAILAIEKPDHPVAKSIPETFASSTNEWYKWKNDLRKNPEIEILASIHPESFPLGTGPKLHEIWHSGYYPVIWTHTRYRMIYFNMGHNDIDYEGKTNEELSFTFQNKIQDRIILNAVLWLGNGRRL